MNKSISLLLIYSALNAASAQAESKAQADGLDTQNTFSGLQMCALSQPIWQPHEDAKLNQMLITADNVELNNTQRAKFAGNVNINTLDMQLTAQLAEIDKLLGVLKAQGPVQFASPSSIISSDRLSANLNNKEIDIENAKYQLTQQTGRGQAARLTVGEGNLKLLGASFTTCPTDDEVWSLHADKIVLSQSEGWGETYGTVLKVFDTPILYLPYFTFPISEQRKTGFIEPTLSSSNRNGAEIETPFYWNIAPNIDATLTPRYMSNIGLQLQTEIRYLTEQHQGLIGVEYLNNDDSEPALGERYLFHWQQQSKLNEQWRASIDATNISDDNYVTDLGSDYAVKTDTQLKRSATLTHMGSRWQTDINVQNFEILGDHLASYSAFPQVTFKQKKAYDWHGVNFTLNGEMAHFKNKEAQVDAATRIHLEPKLSYLAHTNAWQMLSEVSLMQTHYQQDGDLTNTSFEKTVNRTLPKVRLYGQLNFERDTSWLVENGVQTLEPRLQYLYIPKKDQSNIALYDTTKLQDDFFGLFREHRFSGVDRIATANQFTLGATTRIFNDQNNEVFNLSAGQIFYISDSAKPTQQGLDSETNYNALFASEAMLHWHRRWYLSSGIQYDTDGKELIQSHVTLDYKGDRDQLVQLNHRFTHDVSGNRIEQMGVFASVPIDNNWQFVASYQRDIETNRSVEVLSGLQYQSCCWAIQISGHRQIETDLNQSISGPDGNAAAFNSGIQLKFITGLDAKKLLDRSIFGYRRPYFLNN